MLKKSLLASTALLLFGACSPDQEIITIQEDELNSRIVALYGSAAALTMPVDGDYAHLPQDPKNPITEEKVILGRFLFHETGLGLKNHQNKGLKTYSCASCHQVGASFTSGSKQGFGEGGMGFGFRGEARIPDPDYEIKDVDFQPLRSPTVLNTTYQEVMLWNGQFGASGPNLGTEAQWTAGTPKAVNSLGYTGLETQAIAGMDVHRLRCDAETIADSPYKAFFDAAFPEVPVPQRYDQEHAGLAIAAYERTLLTNRSPFQKWLRGEAQALGATETEGALLFFGKAQCYQCHYGPGLNGMEFHALGMKDLEGDHVLGSVDEASKLGRGGFTKNPGDDYKFKTPSLYNLKDMGFHGHGSSFVSVREVIRYKNDAVAQNDGVPESVLSEWFVPLGLSDGEVEALTAFVMNALYDPGLARYVPDTLPTGNCFPIADPQGRADIGCN